MKKLVLTFIFSSLICISFSQNFVIENIIGKGNYFKGYLMSTTSTKEEDWTIKNLSVVNNGDSCKVSYKIYYVEESLYKEIPNDTTWLNFDGNFAKLTKKDNSGYTLKHIEYDQIFYDISVNEYVYSYDHYFSIMIHYQVISSSLISRGYTVHIKLTPDEFEKCQIINK